LGRQPIGVCSRPTVDHAGRHARTDGQISSDDRLDIIALDPATTPGHAGHFDLHRLHPIQAIVDHGGATRVTVQPAGDPVSTTTNQAAGAQPAAGRGNPEGGTAHPTENVVYVALHGRSTPRVLTSISWPSPRTPITNSTARRS
jgi:hypothetical protein